MIANAAAHGLSGLNLQDHLVGGTLAYFILIVVAVIGVMIIRRRK